MQEFKLWDLIQFLMLNADNNRVGNGAYKEFHTLMRREEVCAITWQEFSITEPPPLKELEKTVMSEFFPIYKCLDFQRTLRKLDNITVSTCRIVLTRD